MAVGNSSLKAYSLFLKAKAWRSTCSSIGFLRLQNELESGSGVERSMESHDLKRLNNRNNEVGALPYVSPHNIGAVITALPGVSAIIDDSVSEKRVVARNLSNMNITLCDSQCFS